MARRNYSMQYLYKNWQELLEVLAKVKQIGIQT